MSGNEEHTRYFAHTGWNLCCRQATYLLVKKEELQKLSFGNEVALKFHLAICKFCRAFRRQSKWMDEAIAETVLENRTRLPEKDKNNLKLLISSNLNSN